MHSPKRRLATIASLLLLIAGRPQPVNAVGVIWIDRGDVASLDLTMGPAGKDREPGTDFRFIEESRGGTSAKFVVQDERGAMWKVKLGPEAKGETAAARLLWAAGYIVDDDYYRERIRVRDLARLVRGQEFVSGGDTVTGVRLERAGNSKGSRTWSWYDNPFVGTREFNGLRVMMALINNWDLKEVNNSASADDQYSVSDLGATFGRTGDSLTRSKGVLEDYAAARFIEKITPTFVDLRMHSRPFFLSVVNVANYRTRSRMEDVARGIPIADARWIGQRLGQLSAEQIRDCFRAGGFSPAEVEGYAQVVLRRIAELKALDVTPTPESANSCLDSTCRQVPERETLTAIPIGTPYAQALVGGFEQGAGMAGGLQVTTAAALPTVEVRAEVLTSTRRDTRVELGAYLPHIAGSRNYVDVWVSEQHRDTAFFPDQPGNSAALDRPFDITRRSYQGSLVRDVAIHVQGGAYAQVTDTHATFDDVISQTTIFSYGAFLTYDSRDNSRGLTRGLTLYGRVASADGVGNGGASASSGWLETELDARVFAPLGGSRTSLLLRTRSLLKAPKTGKQIPFYDLSWLGGREYLRGYDSYRFRAANALLLSSELQRTVRAITSVRGIDLFAAADVGQAWGDGGHGSDTWRSGLGGGVQYRHSPTFAGRVEISHSPGLTRVYYSMSRGF